MTLTEKLTCKYIQKKHGEKFDHRIMVRYEPESIQVIGIYRSDIQADFTQPEIEFFEKLFSDIFDIPLRSIYLYNSTEKHQLLFYGAIPTKLKLQFTCTDSFKKIGSAYFNCNECNGTFDTTMLLNTLTSLDTELYYGCPNCVLHRK